MIQYTGTSSRSNYNDERTATIAGVYMPALIRFVLSAFGSFALSNLALGET